MEQYLEGLSQWNPMKYEAEVFVQEKKDAFAAYQTAFLPMKSEGEVELFNLQRFSEVWDVIFPEYRYRKWCDIPGHCATCKHIEEARNSTTDLLVHQMAKEAHLLHRGGLFMPERLAYKKRCFESIFQSPAPNETVLSLIIDTMDTQKNGCPKEGTNVFSKPIYQHLIGCKVHGHGVNFYTTFGSISGKSPDMIMFILSREIELFKVRNNGKHPEKIYLQCDGGGENAISY
jgi:hypothetical protein